MDSPVQKIKERLGIEEVVSTYIKLEPAGQNLRAKCPFHNEKTPSFFVSPGRGSYYCFGCSASGDIFTFVEQFEGLDFKGALKVLAERAGVPLTGYSKEEESEKDRLFKAMEEATKFFVSNINENPKALEYLRGRGLTDKSITDFRIGFAKNSWDSLYTHLKSLKFSDREIELAGLAKKGEKGGQYDRFRSRIIFPIADTSGRVIAFSGRLFEEGLPKDVVEKSAKYLNSPDTPIFNKSAVLFGLDRAKDSIRKNNFTILVEGQMDLVLSHQAGFRNTVATSGTALSDSTLTREQAVSNLGLVRRLTQNIVIAFDADKAGLSASERGSKIALSLGMDVKIAKIEKGFDPADLISKKGPDAWREAIRNSKHIIEFLVEKTLEAESDPRKSGRAIKEKVLPYIYFIESSIEQTHFLKRISDMSGIPLDALQADLRKVAIEQKSETEEIKEAKTNERNLFRRDYIERRIMGIVLWQKSLLSKSLDVNKILNALSRIYEKDESEILKNFDIEREDLIYEAEVFYGSGGTDLKKDVNELVANLEEEFLKERLGKSMHELHLAEEKGDKDKSLEILTKCQEINNKIQEIKSGRTNNIFE